MTRNPEFRSRLRAGLVLALLAWACAGAFPGPAAAEAVEPDSHFNRLFARQGGGWTGGDGTLSVRLPDGRSVWLFGDSFFGSVRPDGTRDPDTPLVRNCLVVQQAERLQTLPDDPGPTPPAFFPSPDPDGWYWPGDGTVAGDTLWVFLHRFRPRTPKLWDWRFEGNALARIALPALRLEAIEFLPVGRRILYGVALLEDEGQTYIFGVEDRGADKYVHLARAVTGNLAGPWEVRSTGGWSRELESSVRLLAGVSTQYSVVRCGRSYLLFTMDGRQAFSETIVSYRAPNPWGPWSGPKVRYRVPEARGDLVAYNPFVHTQFPRDGLLLVSYNLNHVRDPQALYRDVSIYRPRFVRIRPP